MLSLLIPTSLPYLVMMPAQSFQTLFFAFCCVWQPLALENNNNNGLGKRNCYKLAFSNVVLRYGGRETILSILIIVQ